MQPGVAFAARWRYATVGLAAAFFILCMSLLGNGHVRFIFFPQIEGNNISATVTMPEGTPFERTDAAIRRMTAAAQAVADEAREETGESLFVSVTATSGGLAANNSGPGGQSSFSSSENIGQIRIELTPYGERQTPAADIERRWRAAVGRIEGAERVSFNSGFEGFGSDIEFELAHQDEAALIGAADAMKSRLAGIDGVSQVEDSFDLGKRQLVFELTPAGRAKYEAMTDKLGNDAPLSPPSTAEPIAKQQKAENKIPRRFENVAQADWTVLMNYDQRTGNLLRYDPESG